MDKNEFCRKLEELLEVSSGSLNTDSVLAEIEEWDSIAVVSFIALADADYGAAVSPKGITECRVVGDLADLIVRHQS